ncbi:VOC family protein [Streptomyces sp. NPDC088147]|uniref:VOC family protein n=1 Tax=unclassified Streptomyces TaxID=2593676 RepID=UPI00364E018C
MRVQPATESPEFEQSGSELPGFGQPGSEQPEFDHLVHCVPDVESAVRGYTEAGLPAHANPEYLGYRNGAWRLDSRYIELSSVVNRLVFLDSPYGRAMRGWQPRADELVARGGGALVFCVHVTDAGATAERLRARGHGVELLTFAREGSPVSFREAILTDGPPWAPFFVTYEPDRQTILAKYSAGRVNRGPHDLAGILVETPDPRASARWLGELLGIPPGASPTVVPLPFGQVHFTEGPADAITALLLSGGDPPTTVIEGLAVRPVESVTGPPRT